MGWAGANSNAAVVNVAGSQEVVMSTSGGLGEAETAGVVLNVVPRDGGNTFSGTGRVFRLQQQPAEQQLHPGVERRRPAVAVGADQGLGVQPDGRRPHRPRPPVVLPDLPRVVCREHGPRHVLQQERRATRRNGSSISTPARPAFSDTRVRNYIGRLTWQISPRNKINYMNSEQYSSSNRTGGGSATRTPEAQGLNLYTPGHTRTLTWSSPVHQPSAARGRLGQLHGELRQRRAAHRRPAQSGR